MFLRKVTLPTFLSIIIVGYLFYDLRITKGSLYNAIERCSKPSNLEPIACVRGLFITQKDVEKEVEAYLYRRGLVRSTLNKRKKDEIFRNCLDELITGALVSTQIDPSIEEDSAFLEEKVLQELSFDKKQFSDSYEFRDALRRGQHTEQWLRDRALSYIVECQRLRSVTQPPLQQVLEPNSFKLMKVRHIFLSSWQKDPEAVKRTLQQHLQSLKGEQLTFSELSNLINEDLRARSEGGNLGWMTSCRLPQGLEKLYEIPLETPTLMRSVLGWHYMEVLGRKQMSAFTGSRFNKTSSNKTIQKTVLKEFCVSLREKSRKDIEFFTPFKG